MRRSERGYRPGRFLVILGLLLLLGAAGLTGYNIWDADRADKAAAAALDTLSSTIREGQEELKAIKAAAEEEGKTFVPDYELDPNRPMPVETVDGMDYVGQLDIPVLGLSLPVIEQWSYPALKRGPCRYVGTAYQPGFVIAAHNYRMHFGHIKDLQAGDAITFTDFSGGVFRYTVAAVEVLEPTDITNMVSTEWDLTLFTCTLGGKARVSVRCTAA